MSIDNGWSLLSHENPAQALDDPKTGIKLPSTHPTLSHVRSWKDLCRKRLTLKLAWEGKDGQIESFMEAWPQVVAAPEEDDSQSIVRTEVCWHRRLFLQLRFLTYHKFLH